MLKIAQYVLGAGLLLGASAASAGDLPPDAADGVMNSCRADYHRICQRVVPGDGRVARCLLDHEMELSPSCLQTLKIASAVEDCLPDYDRYCRGVPKGKEAFQCLADRIERLAPACQRIVEANAPYMQPDRGRYAYNGGSDPYYRDPAPYSSRAPYDGENPGAYAYREELGAGNYGAPREPQGQPHGAQPYQPYNGSAYPADPRHSGSYSYSGPPRERNDPYAYHYGPGYGGRYAEGAPRFRSYDGSETGSAYAPPYNAPRAPY
jgi:hypothetical protein